MGEKKETLADNMKSELILGWSPKKKIEDYIKENL